MWALDNIVPILHKFGHKSATKLCCKQNHCVHHWWCLWQSERSCFIKTWAMQNCLSLQQHNHQQLCNHFIWVVSLGLVAGIQNWFAVNSSAEKALLSQMFKTCLVCASIDSCCCSSHSWKTILLLALGAVHQVSGGDWQQGNFKWIVTSCAPTVCSH